jgi:trans-aconitate methyltransferase
MNPMNSIEGNLDVHAEAYAGNSLYDFDNAILMHWYPRRVLTSSPGARSLLELGLGHGHTVEIFSTHFDRHVILDGSAAVIDNFRAKHPGCRAEIIETYFENFSTDERFDVIVMGFVLEHVADPSAILKRFKRFLSPGGKLFIAVPNAEVLNRRLGHLAGMLPDIQTLSEHDVLLGHRRYYTVASLSQDIDAAGYRISGIEGIYLKPLTTGQMISLALNDALIDALCQVGVHYPELCCGILAQASVEEALA